MTALTEQLLRSVARLKIAVVGDFCLDAYWTLADVDSETSVETGLHVRRVGGQRYGLGGAGNVVANLRALGVTDMRAIGVHGADPFGAVLRALLVDAGADVGGLRDLGPAWQTSVYAKPLDGGREEPRLDFGSRECLPQPAAEALLGHVRAAAAWADAVVVNQQVDGAFADKTVVDGINEIIADHPGCLFVVDAREAAGQFQGAVLKVNAGEAGAVLDLPTATADQVAEAARALSRRCGRPVFVTRGDRGIVAADGDLGHRVWGVEITRQVDPVGAGDTVTAAVAALLAAGADVATAATLANVAAAATVTTIGSTGTVSAADLVRAAADPDYRYEPELADNPARATYLAGTRIEVVVAPPKATRPTHVVFDHDGTLSTLRQGWEEVMEPMMMTAILGDRSADVDGETYLSVRTRVRDYIERTTGIQTLVQMVGLVDLVREFGFVPAADVLDAAGYKAIYNEQLLAGVHARLDTLRRGHLAREDFHLKNALPLLDGLRSRGVTMHLASGTDVDDVVAEATALGFGEFFGDRIHGAVGDVTVEAKRQVLERLFRDEDLGGRSFATFGDGPVEMRETRKFGGVAVGVCSDETRRYGHNPAKRGRLIRGGATLLVADYSDLDSIFTVLGL